MRPLPLACRWVSSAPALVLCLVVHLDAVAARGQAPRARLQSTADGEVQSTRRPVSLLGAAQTDLFEGRYAAAASSFGAVASDRSVKSNDTLETWAYHGMAIARALSGDRQGARAIYDELLRITPESPLAIADSIEAAVLTDRRDAARALLDRFAATRLGVLPQQYAHSFRALSYMIAGQCAAAVDELRRAPDPGRPLPQAIRGRCAATSGHHAEAIALRDSVLTQPLADRFSWPMIIARGLARKIE